MNKWNCDICGKRTMINPPHEFVFEQDGTKEVPELDKDGKPQFAFKGTVAQGVKMKQVPNMVPKMGTMYQQDMQTGEIKEVQVQQMKFLEEPTVIIKLKVRHESFQRDFCLECMEKYCGEEVRALKEKLVALKMGK